MVFRLSPRSLALLVGLLVSRLAAAEPHWNLPIQVSDSNTTLRVSVETAGDTVAGLVRSLSGKMWLEDPRDPTTIRAEISVPTTGIETGSPARDFQLRAILGAFGGSGATVALRADGEKCFPGYVDRGRPCEGTLRGEVAFQGMRRPISLPFQIRREGPRYRVDGRLSLPGSAFMAGNELTLLLGLLKQVTVAYTSVL